MHTADRMQSHYTDAQRMALRSYVSLAGEVIPRVWPMQTIIARNPLQGLEDQKFEDAVERGEHLFGGRSTLPGPAFREAFRTGRIKATHLEAVLKPIATETHVAFGDRVLSHLDVLRLSMTEGIQRLGRENSSPPWSQEQSALFDKIAACTRRIGEGDTNLSDQGLACVPGEAGRLETLAAWCDRTLGTEMTSEINRHMIKWCAAFCDEGEAVWPMPKREETFFRAWKAAAQYDVSLRCSGIERAASKIRALADRPEDALLQSLDRLQVPNQSWQEYLSLHLAALPGWAGFIKWREEQTSRPWQIAYRIDLVKYLAVRLFYEQELVESACRKALGCAGTIGAIEEYARQFPHSVWLKRASVSGCLSEKTLSEAARLQGRWTRCDATEWERHCARWFQDERDRQHHVAVALHVHACMKIAEALGLPASALISTPSSDLSVLVNWLDRFTVRQQELKWLEAFELAHQHEVLRQLAPSGEENGSASVRQGNSARPLAQFAFCIDVRSEVFRRHLEQCGPYETFGFAGFFGLPFSYQSLDEQGETTLCPVLLKSKHLIREVPRTYQKERAQRRRKTTHFVHASHELLHDLKHNVITPYVMVEAIGWFFLVPFIGKTLCPRWYHRLSAFLKSVLMPAVSTTLTVDKFSTADAENMLAAEQRLQIAAWLRTRMQALRGRVTAEALEDIRRQALEPDQQTGAGSGPLGRLLSLPREEETIAIEALRRDCRLTSRGFRSRLDRITRTGFTVNEQAYYVETALRLMGLTGPFARLIVLCGHGSTSENNPYESSLDCGACGGGQGLPNARVFAMIANRPQVRDLLAGRGLTIPSDTHFVAALHDTTTDQVRIADLEDIPSTHRKEFAQIQADVHAAGAAAAAERWAALSATPFPADQRECLREIERRSVDWGQVRPEWGLARNSVFIVGRRRMTEAADLCGRSFLHSYDHVADKDGRLLEVIMTAPLIVAQWINMEYYFSTVAPEVYGSGSKIYHNVTGRIGVMTGGHSDLRMGLPAQTVLKDGVAYHEPMRLTAIIEAPCDRITAIINRQPLLEKLFHNQWLLLVAYEPSEQRYYRYHGINGWRQVVEPGDHFEKETISLA